jgi:predicted component of type VI protein secretion system
MKTNRLVLLLLFLSSAPAFRLEAQQTKALTPAETFEELKKLCGEWKGTTASGRTGDRCYT